MNNLQPGGPSRRHAIVLLLALLAVAFLTSSAQASSLSSSPSSVAFGTVSLGNKVTRTLAITNVTTAGVTVSAATMSNGEFSISSLVMPFTVNSGATTYFAVGFKPTVAGAVTGTLTLKNSSGTVLLTVSLSGTGASATSAPPLTSTPSSVSFGSVAVGNKLTQTLMIKNVSTSSVSVSSISISNSVFSIGSVTVPFSIAAGATTYFAVGFKPTVAGGFTASLTLKNSSGAALVTVPLSGTGSTSTSSLVSSQSSLSFGSETVGQSTTLPVTLTNKGTSNVTISGVSITGSSAAYNVTGGISGATLAPGQSTIMNIVFAPNTTGTLNGTVTVVSSATSAAPAIAVSGTGVSNTSHSVKLSWQASASTGILGYYVYRSGVSGSYTRLNSAPTGSLQYTDGSVASGATYYYVVTSVTSAGVESVQSSKVPAVIP